MKKILRYSCLSLCLLALGLAFGRGGPRPDSGTGCSRSGCSGTGHHPSRRRTEGRRRQGARHGGLGQGRSRRHNHRNDQRRSGGGLQSWRDASRRRQPSWAKQNRRQLHLDAGHRLPRHVHAGRIRHGGVGPVPREKRQPHVHDELLRVHVRFVRLLDTRLCHTDGWSGRQRQPGRPAIPDRRTLPSPYSERLGACSARRECS